MKKKIVKKRGPQDTTLRNVRAANKKLFDLTARVKRLEEQSHDAWASGAQLKNLELRVLQLEKQLDDVDPVRAILDEPEKPAG